MSNVEKVTECEENPKKDSIATNIPEKTNKVSIKNSHLSSNDSKNTLKNAIKTRVSCPGRDYNWNTTHFFPDLRLVNLSGFLKTNGRKFEYKSNNSQRHFDVDKDHACKNRTEVQKNLNTNSTNLKNSFRNLIDINESENNFEKILTYSGHSFTYCNNCGDNVETHTRNLCCHDNRPEKLSYQHDAMTNSSSSMNSHSQSSSSTISFAVASSDDSDFDDMYFDSVHRSSKSWDGLNRKLPSLFDRNDVVRKKFNNFSDIKNENYLKKMKFFGLLKNEQTNNLTRKIERTQDIANNTGRSHHNDHCQNMCEITFEGYDQYNDGKFKKEVGEKVALSDNKEILLKAEKDGRKAEKNKLQSYSEQRILMGDINETDCLKNIESLHEKDCINNEFFSNIDDPSSSEGRSGKDNMTNKTTELNDQELSNDMIDYISSEFESDCSFYNEKMHNDIDEKKNVAFEEEDVFYDDCGIEKSNEEDETEAENEDKNDEEKQDQGEKKNREKKERNPEKPKTIGKLNSGMIKMFETAIKNSAKENMEKKDRKIETNYLTNENMNGNKKQTFEIASKEVTLNKKPPIHPFSKTKSSSLLVESIKNDDGVRYINEGSERKIYEENDDTKNKFSNSYMNPLYQNEGKSDPNDYYGKECFKHESTPKTLENSCLDYDINGGNQLKKGTVKKLVNVFDVDSHKLNIEKITENTKDHFCHNKSAPSLKNNNENRRIETIQNPQKTHEEYYDLSNQQNGVTFSITGYNRVNNNSKPLDSIEEDDRENFIPIFNDERKDNYNTLWGDKIYENSQIYKDNFILVKQDNDVSKRKPITNWKSFEHEFPPYDDSTNRNIDNNLKQQYQLQLQLSSLHLEEAQLLQTVTFPQKSPPQQFEANHMNKKLNHSFDDVNSKTAIKRNTEIFKNVNRNLNCQPYKQKKDQVICLDQNTQTQTFKKQKGNPEIQPEKNTNKPLKKHAKLSLKDTLKKQCREGMMNAIKKSKSIPSHKQTNQKHTEHPKQKSELRKENRFQFVPRYQQMLLLQQKRQHFLQNQQKQKLVENFENLTILNALDHAHEEKQGFDSKTLKKKLIKKIEKTNKTQSVPLQIQHSTIHRDQTLAKKPQTDQNHITIYYGYPHSKPKLEPAFDENKYFIAIRPAIDQPDLHGISAEKLKRKSYSSFYPLTIEHHTPPSRHFANKPLIPTEFPIENNHQVLYRTSVFSKIECPDRSKNASSFSSQNHFNENKTHIESPSNNAPSKKQTFVINTDNVVTSNNHIYLNNRSPKNQFHNFNLIFNSKNLDHHSYQYDNVVSNNPHPPSLVRHYANFENLNKSNFNNQNREYIISHEPTINAIPLTISVIENQIENRNGLTHFGFRQTVERDESVRKSEKNIISKTNMALESFNRPSNVETIKDGPKSTSVNIKLQNYREDIQLKRHENDRNKTGFIVHNYEVNKIISESDDDEQLTVAQVKAKLFGKNEEKAKTLLGINKKSDNLTFSKDETQKKLEKKQIQKQEKLSENKNFESFSASKSFDVTRRSSEFSKRDFALELSQKAEGNEVFNIYFFILLIPISSSKQLSRRNLRATREDLAMNNLAPM